MLFFGVVFCLTSSNFYLVEKVGLQSGTPAPAREVPGPFHFLVEMITGIKIKALCFLQTSNRNQCTLEFSRHLPFFRHQSHLLPAQSKITKNHQTEINDNQCTLQFQGICHDVLWNESNFGNFWRKHAKTIRRYPKSIAAPVPVMRNVITRRMSSKV